MYEISFSQSSEKQLYKLPSETSERILAALKRIRIRPHTHAKRLIGSPYYSLRVGDYRIILDIHDGNLLILVIEIGHRKNIYK